MECPLCPKECKEDRVNGRIQEIQCPACGKYQIETVARSRLQESGEDNFRISSFTREATIRKKLYLILDSPTSEAAPTDWPSIPITIKEIVSNRFPVTPQERFDRALVNIALLSKHMGENVEVMDHCLLFARNIEESYFVANALKHLGFVDADLLRNGRAIIRLTPSGWSHYHELIASRPNLDSHQGFVAMMFGNADLHYCDQPSHEFSANAFIHGFDPAIRKAGYSPRRIDFKDFIDDVNDEIIAEIRKSRFVVADFTGQRAGVYFEAGFAKGLNIPVIFTCHSDDMKNCHFDTNHYNHIAWTDVNDLSIALERRILANLGQGPLSQATLKKDLART